MTDQAPGLTSQEAARRLAAYGPNEIAEERPHRLRRCLSKLWAPIPWMLEATIVLMLILGRLLDTGIIGFLLVFNAVISYLQEAKAETALELLRQRLTVNARVLRDGAWRVLPARELVPGDVVHLRMGDIVPADLRLTAEGVVLDQSPLTGESVPVERDPGDTAYAGAVVKRGEATGEVLATGAHTYFGRTTELVKIARTASHLETLIMRIVRYLVGIDLLLVLTMLLFAVGMHIPLLEMLPFALILLVASVPVALPATFTLAEALGAQELANRGVLVTRLSAIEEAAGMDVLCTDKTGTITLNRLSLEQLAPYPPFTADSLLELAALASDPATQDPIDLAILDEEQRRGGQANTYERLEFSPFDPATKRTEALLRRAGETLRVLKGAPQVLAGLVEGADQARVARDTDSLAAQGFRVLAVAAGPEGRPALAGLLALRDPPRPDSKELIAQLGEMGVHPRMLTGDTAPTARAIAAQVGIGARVCEASTLRQDGGETVECDVYAGIFPEDKFHLIRRLQEAGHVVGMTGDGVNDAPALKQAELGIAVSSATDAAKAAASMILTEPGLLNAVAAIGTSRRIYRRMHTYTLNKIIKTVQVAFFVIGAFFLTDRFVVTPFLLVLLLFANDFVTMSLASDRVRFNPQPDHWRVKHLVATALVLAGVLLVQSFLVLYLAAHTYGLSWPRVQTAVFLNLVFSSQATVYVIRELRHFWASCPGTALLAASAGDLAAVSTLALTGVFMAPLPAGLVALVLGLAVVFMLPLEAVKRTLLRRWGES